MEVRKARQDEAKENLSFAEIAMAKTAEIKVSGGRGYLFVKRAFDLVASSLALVVCSVPMGILALLIKSESEGPAIYKQERLGLNGKPFVIYKFRSMRLDAEKDGAQWAEVNDERCTRIGRFIRKYHVDELPQLWNIIRGDMSIVGPRPERAIFYKEFAEYIDGFEVRLGVKPGLTGWAQVNGCYDLLPEEKLDYDIFYMENRSVGLDIKCILKTVLLVLNGEGAR